MPRPVLPDPVMPTITPWVVRSPEAIVVGCVGALVLDRVDLPAEEEVSHAAHVTRAPSSGGGRLDPIGAAAVAGHHVLHSGDLGGGPEHALEDVELGTAQRTARRGGLADRAVVLDQEVGAVVGADLGEVALVGAEIGQALHAFAEIARRRRATAL